MKKYIVLIFFSLFALSVAHLEGESITVGDYKIELASLPEELMTYINSDIIISIENATTGERMPGTEFWARLSLNDSAVLSSSNFITDNTGSSDINYVFQKPGHYQLDVSLKNTNVTTLFHLRVLEEYKVSSVPLYMVAAAAVFFVVGLAVGFVFSRRMRK